MVMKDKDQNTQALVLKDFCKCALRIIFKLQIVQAQQIIFIYYDDNFIIKEWVFRRGNDDDPTLVTSFEDYTDYSGLKIATSHKQKEGNWNLKFRDVMVEMK